MADPPPQSRDPTRARIGRAISRLSGVTRTLLALAILLAGVALWLETVAPAQPLVIFLVCVAATGMLCGVSLGVGVALGAALAIWWFALSVPGEMVVWPPGAARLMLSFAAGSVAILAATAAMRRWVLASN